MFIDSSRLKGIKIGLPLKYEDGNGPENDENEEEKPEANVTVSALPNICYSCALAYLEKGNRTGKSGPSII